jgi:hypothetical protein
VHAGEWSALPCGSAAPPAERDYSKQGTEEKKQNKNIRGKLQNKKQEQEEGSRKEQGTEVVGTPYPVIGHRTQ